MKRSVSTSMATTNPRMPPAALWKKDYREPSTKIKVVVDMKLKRTDLSKLPS